MDKTKLLTKLENNLPLTLQDFEGIDVDQIVNILEDLEVVEWSTYEYGEPGYKNPSKKILFGDWNKIDNDLMDKIIDNGYEMEWVDEWIESVDEKAFRIQPDSMFWVPSYFIYDGLVYGIKDYEEMYVEEYLLNNHESVAPDWLDLSKYGFTKLEKEHCIGMYEVCSNVAPKDIVAQEVKSDEDFVFQIDDNGPWHISFSLWKRNKKLKEVA